MSVDGKVSPGSSCDGQKHPAFSLSLSRLHLFFTSWPHFPLLPSCNKVIYTVNGTMNNTNGTNANINTPPIPQPSSGGGEFDGSDFSNNLFSDLAPLLTLFGEQVTKQFFSQAVCRVSALLVLLYIICSLE